MSLNSFEFYFYYQSPYLLFLLIVNGSFHHFFFMSLCLGANGNIWVIYGSKKEKNNLKSNFQKIDCICNGRGIVPLRFGALHYTLCGLLYSELSQWLCHALSKSRPHSGNPLKGDFYWWTVKMYVPSRSKNSVMLATYPAGWCYKQHIFPCLINHLSSLRGASVQNRCPLITAALPYSMVKLQLESQNCGSKRFCEDSAVL